MAEESESYLYNEDGTLKGGKRGALREIYLVARGSRIPLSLFNSNAGMDCIEGEARQAAESGQLLPHAIINAAIVGYELNKVMDPSVRQIAIEEAEDAERFLRDSEQSA